MTGRSGKSGGLSFFGRSTVDTKSGGKVLHVSNDLHARVKAHCAQLGVPMAHWVSDLILEGARQAGDLAFFRNDVSRYGKSKRVTR